MRGNHRDSGLDWVGIWCATVTVLALNASGCTEHATQSTADGGTGGTGSLRTVPDGGVLGPDGQVFFPPPDGGCPSFPRDLVFAGAAGTGAGPAMLPAMLPGPLGGDVVVATAPPPPISGGTLLLTADGKTLVATDPDRNQVYVVDAAAHSLLKTISLAPGDEPGRIVEGPTDQVYVVLRSADAIAGIQLSTGAILRMPVCDLPRGIAFDAATSALHVACADGKLVSLLAPLGTVTRTLNLGRDLRDVVVQGGSLFVTRFRSAELLHVEASGQVSSRYTPPTVSTTEETFVPTDACGGATGVTTTVKQEPTVAWRTLAVPDHGVMMLHQRARVGEISTQVGGYGGGFCGSGIVQGALTLNADRADGLVYPAIDSVTLPVDMAVTPDAAFVAIVAPGNWGSLVQVGVYNLANIEAQAGPPEMPQFPPADGTPAQAGMGAPAGTGGSIGTSGNGGSAPIGFGGCLFPDHTFDTAGQATAVAFVSPNVLAVQTREPAGLEFFDLRTNASVATLMLDSHTRMDTGHGMFHLRAGAGVACASCHAEGGDDGHVWTFEKIGPRRTQHLRGGILGTEPFHWDGDMTDFNKLMTEVFVGRMSGFSPTQLQSDALSHWIDVQPALHAAPSDALAAERGRVLFEARTTGCTSCHAGTALTNNSSADVGTGGQMQVPSLRGVSFRAPFMHDGCAATLRDRFGACGGGKAHGNTADLNDAELTDLVSYLESL